jgi:hypothetical protein
VNKFDLRPNWATLYNPMQVILSGNDMAAVESV